MAERKVTITDDWAYRKIRTVILENEHLKLTVLPEIGAKIYDIIYKPQQKNLLWHNPRIPPRKVPFGAAFDDVWSGGWDEIFPNDAPCNYGGERYPDMGEVWSIPWDYSVSRTEEKPQAVTLVTSVTSPITPCKLTRTLTLKEGELSIHLEYALENLSHDSLKFLWKLHPALAINETCSIEIPASRGIIDPRYRHLYSETSAEYDWPNAINREEKRVNISKIPPATEHCCSLHYVTDLQDGVVKFRNPRDNLDATFKFPKEIFTSVWLFLAYGGYRSLYTAVIEPSTSYPYDLAQAIKEGNFSRIKSDSKLKCDIDLELNTHSDTS